MANKRNENAKTSKGNRSSAGRSNPAEIKAKAGNRRDTRREVREKKRKQQKMTQIIVAMLVLSVAGYAIWGTIAPTLNRPDAPEVSEARRSDNPIRGPQEAVVTVTEFGDFACSACKQWHELGILETILEQYPGQVRLEWRDFPVITGESPKAAEAGQCAYDQGLFWEYHDRVYEEPGSSYGNIDDDDLAKYALDVGLDMDAFNLCLDSGQHAETVQVDLQYSYQQGFSGTPSFMVNSRPVVGNPELIIQAIEAELR